jgi:SAM-dependent methyltransferase
MATYIEDPALSAYERMAPFYDLFTESYDYERWLSKLEALALDHGLSGKRLLDVGCGTGTSFLPMLARGWDVTGCDISPAMLERAREKAGGAAQLAIADMLDLPEFGEFDLVWALDDAINYLLSPGELSQALAGMSANLAPTGLLLFDLNELQAYRTFFAETTVVEHGGRRLTWRGMAAADVPPGSICESEMEVAPGEVLTHRQRHFPEAEVHAALAGAGLDCVAVYGHGLDGIPTQPLAPTHTKAIYIARKAA